MTKLCKCGCGRPTAISQVSRPGRGYIKGEPLPYLRGHHGRDSRLAAPPAPDEDSAYISLTKGRFALVDAADHAWLSQWRWFVTAGYAARWDYSSGRQEIVLMHRVILGVKDDQTVDHINRDSLDNRRTNLRPATMRENLLNRVLPSSTGYRGVAKSGKRWRARIESRGKKRNLGTFGTPEEAARAYDEAARKYHGEFAWLNFSEVNDE